MSVYVKVLQLFKIEEVGQDKKVQWEGSVADHTAATRFVLWEQHVDALEEGKCYNFEEFLCERISVEMTSVNAKERF